MLKPATNEELWKLRATTADAGYIAQLETSDNDWKWLLKGGLKHLPPATLLLFLQRLTERHDGELWKAFQVIVENKIQIERGEQERLFEALRTHYPDEKGTLELAYYLYGHNIPLAVYETYINTRPRLSLDEEGFFSILKEQSKQMQHAVELMMAHKEGWMSVLYRLNKDFDYLDRDVATACLAACWREDLPLYSAFNSHDGTTVTDALQRIATLCVRAQDVEKAAALFQRIQDFCQECKDTPDYLCVCIGTLAPLLMLNGYALLPVEAAAPT